MDTKDLKLIEQHKDSDVQLKNLWKEHVELERKLEKIDRKLYLSPPEEMERKKLQKEKLRGRDKIASILDKYRHPEERGS